MTAWMTITPGLLHGDDEDYHAREYTERIIHNGIIMLPGLLHGHNNSANEYHHAQSTIGTVMHVLPRTYFAELSLSEYGSRCDTHGIEVWLHSRLQPRCSQCLDEVDVVIS